MKPSGQGRVWDRHTSQEVSRGPGVAKSGSSFGGQESDEGQTTKARPEGTPELTRAERAGPEKETRTERLRGGRRTSQDLYKRVFEKD
jgi:hypothetical protein